MSYVARQLQTPHRAPTHPQRYSEPAKDTHEEARNSSDLPELMTVSEVARALRVDDTTVRRWVKNGVLEAVSLPHAGKRQGYRVKRETLEKILDSSAAIPE